MPPPQAQSQSNSEVGEQVTATPASAKSAECAPRALISGQPARKRLRGGDQVVSKALDSACGALSTIMDRMNRQDGQQPSAQASHVDLFFRSLCSQFKLIPTRLQPQIMLRLQECVTNAMLNGNPHT